MLFFSKIKKDKPLKRGKIPLKNLQIPVAEIINLYSNVLKISFSQGFYIKIALFILEICILKNGSMREVKRKKWYFN